MWRYYLRLLRTLPRHIYGATDNVLTGLAVASFVVLLLNKNWLTALDDAAAGISRAWALVPIGLFVLYALLEANYEHVQDETTQLTPEELASKLEGFLVATNARIPKPSFDFQLMLSDPAASARLQAEQTIRVNEIVAGALGEYHDRFRHLVAESLHDDPDAVALARSPERLAHLRQLVKALRGQDWRSE